uniref:Heat shock protein b8 n=1 Tax=Cyprinus carpio TaxID=7962 RepID=A0A8C2PTI1_CYPCA
MLCLDVEHQAVTGSSVQCQIRLKLSILLCTKLCAFIHPAQKENLSINHKACCCRKDRTGKFNLFTMAEGDYYTMGTRQRIPRDPFGEQSLASRFMDDDFGLPPFHDELSMDWPGWARPRLSTRLDAPWTGQLRTGFPRGFSARYSEGPRRSSAPLTNPDEPWKVCVNVHSFRPEELNVKTKDGFVEVSESHPMWTLSLCSPLCLQKGFSSLKPGKPLRTTSTATKCPQNPWKNPWPDLRSPAWLQPKSIQPGSERELTCPWYLFRASAKI